MPYDLAVWIGEYYALIIVLVGGLLIGIAAEQIRAAQRRRAWLEKNGSRTPQRDSADQLRVVMRSDFFAQPLLNRSEARLFRELDRFVLARNPQWQVMAQVSLGEILRGSDAEAHSCINSKRVDLLVVNENCQPMHVIEYQGAGHYRGTAAARDAVKKEALRRAGISYHEVIAGRTTPAELRRLVDTLLQPASAAEPAAIPAAARANGA